MLKSLAVSLCILASVAHAGPDDTTQRLMNENVSLLDWGLYRLQEHLEYFEYLGHPSVTYDWDKNQIQILSYSSDVPHPAITAELAAVKCANWFAAVRLRAGVDPDSGQLFDDSISDFRDFFGHAGWVETENGTTTDDVLPDLDSKFYLVMQVNTGLREVGQTRSIKCSGELLSNTFAKTENLW